MAPDIVGIEDKVLALDFDDTVLTNDPAATEDLAEVMYERPTDKLHEPNLVRRIDDKVGA